MSTPGLFARGGPASCSTSLTSSMQQLPCSSRRRAAASSKQQRMRSMKRVAASNVFAAASSSIPAASSAAGSTFSFLSVPIPRGQARRATTSAPRRGRREVSAASTPPVESSEAEAEAGAGAGTGARAEESSSSKNQDEALAAARLLEVEIDEAEAKGETVAATVGLAAVIGAVLYALKGTETAQAYFAGYLLEQSLSVDNLFVFVLVFRYFGVSGPGQDRVLAWGIASAAVLRLLMVAAGAELIENFKPVLLVFAAILVYSSIKLAFVDSGEDDDEKEDLSDNAIVKLCKRFLTVSDEYDGVKFFTEVEVSDEDSSGNGNGGSSSSSLAKTTKRVATPLLLVLAVIELSDVVFAVDSVPAVFGVSRDPVVVWSASMAAIASLRALYGFVATALGTLKYLDKAVAAVLAWVGGKMIFEFFSGIEVSTALSLGVVVACLVAGVAASLAVGGEGKEEEGEKK